MPPNPALPSDHGIITAAPTEQKKHQMMIRSVLILLWSHKNCVAAEELIGNSVP